MTDGAVGEAALAHNAPRLVDGTSREVRLVRIHSDRHHVSALLLSPIRMRTASGRACVRPDRLPSGHTRRLDGAGRQSDLESRPGQHKADSTNLESSPRLPGTFAQTRATARAKRMHDLSSARSRCTGRRRRPHADAIHFLSAGSLFMAVPHARLQQQASRRTLRRASATRRDRHEAQSIEPTLPAACDPRAGRLYGLP